MPFSGAVTLPLLTATGTIFVPDNYSGAVTLPLLTATGTMPGADSWVLAAPIPALTISGTLVGGNSFATDINETFLPSLTISAFDSNGRLDEALPALSITGSIIVGAKASLNSTLPLLELSGSFDNASSSSVSGSLTSLYSSGLLLTGSVLDTLIAEIPTLEIKAIGVTGNLLTLTKDLPALTLEISFLSDGVAVLNKSLPALAIIGTIINGQPFTASSYSINTENFGLSEYANFDYIYLGECGNKFFGIKRDGVYELTGATDVGIQIDASIVTGLSDLGSENLKRATKAYIGYTSDGDMDLSIITDGEPVARTYELRRENFSSGQKHARVPLSRGLKSRYWKIGIQNKLGADFEIDMISLLAEPLLRKT